MGDDEFGRQLIRAAEVFPVRGRSVDVQRRVVRRRRITAGYALAAGVAATAGVMAVIAMMTGWSPGPGRSVAPASTVSADYVGSGWRLTNVAERGNATAIPADVGASMNLVSDGRILVEDGRNYHTGWFTKSADGFDVTPYKQTLVSAHLPRQHHPDRNRLLPAAHKSSPGTQIIDVD